MARHPAQAVAAVVSAADGSNDLVSSLERLADLMDTAEGSEAAVLAAAARESGALARLAVLIAEERPQLHLVALRLLAYFTTSDVDPLGADDSRAVLEAEGCFTRLLPHLFSNVALRAALACSILENAFCANPTHISELQLCGGVSRCAHTIRRNASPPPQPRRHAPPRAPVWVLVLPPSTVCPPN